MERFSHRFEVVREQRDRVGSGISRRQLPLKVWGMANVGWCFYQTWQGNADLAFGLPAAANMMIGVGWGVGKLHRWKTNRGW